MGYEGVRGEQARRFGDRVRELRIAKGLTQEGLAEQAGMHRTYVGCVERGDRNLSLFKILELADGLGVPARDLFD